MLRLPRRPAFSVPQVPRGCSGRSSPQRSSAPGSWRRPRHERAEALRRRGTTCARAPSDRRSDAILARSRRGVTSHPGVVATGNDGDSLVTSPSRAPMPTLPVGAGGPPVRASGRVFCAPREPLPRPVPAPATEPVTACVIEADPLLRLHAVAAAGALGFAVAPEDSDGQKGECCPSVIFVGLDRVDQCARCGPRRLDARDRVLDVAWPRGAREVCSSAGRGGMSSERPLIAGYCSGSRVVLEAHRLHGCADVVLELRAVADRPRFVYPADVPTGVVDLTPREADVLLLLLEGFGTTAVATRLHLSPATVTSHCRAILRKCGAADRRALRSRLLGAGSPAEPMNEASGSRGGRRGH
jgi:DNA-binding CsgD family transcriptional regulator